MNPAGIIKSLIKSGMSEQRIADQLLLFGVSVTQSTVNRIKNGEIEQPKFDVGTALVRLWEQHLAEGAKKNPVIPSSDSPVAV
jgi:hypothetical protein